MSITKPRHTTPFWLTLLLLLLSTTLTGAANAPTTVATAKLGGADRQLAYLSTDKPVYRTGETIFFRTVILNAADNTPLDAGKQMVTIKIAGPRGDIIHQGQTVDDNSALGYQWPIPDGIAGGEYTATVSSPALGLPETQRQFDIRAFRAPRVKTQIQFGRDGYGPGDRVSASISIERAEGGIPEGATVSAIARLDNREIYRQSSGPLAASGVVDVAFELPQQIASGEGSLSFVIEDGGGIETATKSLPVLLQQLDIAFYPESGDLVAGLNSRVYFQALQPNGKPADIRGHIVELHDNATHSAALAQFSSAHEGRGTFSFTPAKGKRYAAIITEPAGISQLTLLPNPVDTGAVISSPRDTFDFTDSITLAIASSGQRTAARVTLHKRDLLLDTQIVNGDSVTLSGQDAEGVLIATAWDGSGQPLAERLIYRHPRFGLNISLALSPGPFIPGAPVSVDIQTTDDRGNPVEAMVAVTVTDDSVLELIDKREQPPRLPTMVYLEHDVLDLADAHVYLDKANPQANASIDLLLGTQGWRRFILADFDQIHARYPLQSARAMAQKTPTVIMFRKHAAPFERAMLRANQFAIAMEGELAVEPAALDAGVPMALPQAMAQQLDELATDAAVAAIAEAPEPPIAPIADAIAAGMPGEGRPAARMMPIKNRGFVREYAYRPRADRKPGERSNFSETLYWNNAIKTNPRNGRATIKFALSDSVTTFRVMADGWARNGALGSGDSVIASVEPFYVSAKMPLHATVADTIELPVTLVNTTAKPIANATLQVSGDGIDSQTLHIARLAANQRLRRTVTVKARKPGTFAIALFASAGPYHDTVTRQITVNPGGFPVAINHGGLLSSESAFETTIVIPADISSGSLRATARVYPSPLASMEDALDALLREPHGCFEQTSSTNYPLVMAQQYFDSHTGVDPERIAKSRQLLKAGYSKLISFESEDHGYEWFGANPAHEALTAYGLMEFTDMAKVMPVDGAMIDRTRQWLLDRRDGNGGFKRNERALDSFGRAPAPTTDAYIVWALLESGQHADSLSAEIARVKARALATEDSYIVALAANILALAGDTTSADILAKKLAHAVNDNDAVAGASTSITGSGGDALTIETTSLALLAWLNNDAQWAAQVETSIQWLFERSKSGRFGSTQSTILALKAINAYDAARAKPKQPGSVQLLINGKVVGAPVSFDTESKGAIALADFGDALPAGQHRVELRMSDGSKMPFALAVSYNSPVPATAAITPARLSTQLSHSEVSEGEPLEINAIIRNGNQDLPTPVAIIGIPAGLELRHDQLKEHVAAGRVDAYEVRDAELILYWRALRADETRHINIGLTAAVPGHYTGPASRAYPYYTDEQKHWIAGHTVQITAR